MYYIVYVSEAFKPMAEPELAEILRVSRENNERDEITGLLIYKFSSKYSHGSFLQLLEGDKSTVQKTYRRIVKDKRHHTKIVLEQGNAAERQFPDWSMGFKNISPEALASLPGFADIGDEAFDSEAFTRRVKSAVELMKFFYDND